MKIDPGYRPVGQDRLRDNGAGRPVQAKSFADVMHQQNGNRTREELQQKLQDIQAQGERLARSMTVRELQTYKAMVKQFLELTVRRGVGIKDVRTMDRRGRIKRHKLLDEIDESLLAMAEELLKNEQGRMQLLQSVGDIRGLLINLLF
ncbi:YaaR family protein [Paenibacillus pasadenensis]|uniref:YaaR family protein n=1 Tax=Paenibacillus pasadenensis TaxID=217090 RepID=UPI0020404FD3|nr:YaaR family protein [Paenibacillus pasadenensis]MCM3750019.1 YaaR family protein [Paenibacillus pasadenensis]